VRTGRARSGGAKALALSLAVSVLLGGCSIFGGESRRVDAEPSVKGDGRPTGATGALVNGPNGNSSWVPQIFSRTTLPPDAAEDQAKGGIGVNGFLWRASLDTISFMPLASADPFGGVVITEWYSAPDSPDERLKVTVYIMDRRLRADAVRVVVFKQVRDVSGNWSDAAVAPETPAKIENAILTRARQMRIDVIG
jgi:hypothetical protein